MEASNYELFVLSSHYSFFFLIPLSHQNTEMWLESGKIRRQVCQLSGLAYITTCRSPSPSLRWPVCHTCLATAWPIVTLLLLAPQYASPTQVYTGVYNVYNCTYVTHYYCNYDGCSDLVKCTGTQLIMQVLIMRHFSFYSDTILSTKRLLLRI